MAFAEFLGQFHPILVHFPIALWVLAFVFDLISFKDERFAKVGLLLLLIGTLISGFAGVTGIMAQVVEVRRGIPEEPTEYHERWALITMAWFIALSLVRIFHAPSTKTLIPFAIGLAMLTYTGYKGAEIVQEYGATVEGVETLREPTKEALQLLAARQDIESREYSSFMHHMAGIMSILLAIFLAVAHARPSLQAKVIAVTPWLLIAGGIGLFIFSDTDSFPLSFQRPWYKDPEVIFHKVVAFLMIGSGWVGVRRNETVGRSIGLLALAGGGLLFTHIHSVSPYSDVAIGVYMYHMVMASVAILIGVVKLVEERLRLTGYLFPALIAVEAVLLLTYTEGMPWFLGYKPMLRDGPDSDGLTSQIGDHRAMLVFEHHTLTLNVHFYQLDEDKPWDRPFEPIPGIVRAGRESTSILLKPKSPSHFVAEALFLRNASMFTLEIPGVEFEPWTSWKVGSPRIAKSPVCPFEPTVKVFGNCASCGRPGTKNYSYADWICPEHHSISAGEQRTCPLCGRWLQLNPERASVTRLTSDGKIDIKPGLIHVKLNETLEPLRAEYGHVDIVGPGFYAHEHLSPSGECAFTFPHGGRYVIFASVLPKGKSLTVLREEWNEPGTTPPFVQQWGEAVDVEGYRVAVFANPWPPGRGSEISLRFSVNRLGLPVMDLESVDGFGAMCTVVSEDGSYFDTAHPVSGDLRFNTYFPHLGVYRIYFTFRHKGKTVTAPLSLKVSERRLPRAIDLGEH
jgi:uncharacterized membrane protein